MEYITDTGEKVVKKNGLYYLKGGQVILNEREMYQYLLNNASKLNPSESMPEVMREGAEYYWKRGI